MDSDWISVWPSGELSGRRVCVGIRQKLLDDHSAPLTGRALAGVEVMGSDTAIRILDRIVAAERTRAIGDSGAPRYQERVVCCLVRPHRGAAEEAEHIRRVTIPRAADAGVRVILVDTTGWENPLQPVSSTEICELIARHDWKILEARGWLHPRVFRALEAQDLKPR
jgi:hypothetical protein